MRKNDVGGIHCIDAALQSVRDFLTLQEKSDEISKFDEYSLYFFNEKGVPHIPSQTLKQFRDALNKLRLSEKNHQLAL